jgi:hypothetical protein
MRHEVGELRLQLRLEQERRRKGEAKAAVERKRLEDQVQKAGDQLVDQQRRLEERDGLVRELRSQLEALARERAAATARLEAELVELRGRWYEEVQRLEQENTELLAKLEDERARAARPGSPLPPPDSDSEHEPENRFEDRFVESFEERGLHLQQMFEEARADEQKLEQRRQARLAVLEVERAEARRKWHDGLAAALGPSTATPPSGVTPPVETSLEHQVPAALLRLDLGSEAEIPRFGEAGDLESLERDPVVLTNNMLLSPLLEESSKYTLQSEL